MIKSTLIQADISTTAKPNSYMWTTTGGGVLIALSSFLPWIISAITPPKTGP